MQYTPIEKINKEFIEGLLQNSVAESKTLDYKSILPGNGDEDKREFLADVSSFANAAGGYIIFGVEEEGGIPKAIPGVSVDDTDKEKLRLESIIRDGLEPRIPGVQIAVTEGPPENVFLIIHVRRSWYGPHMVKFKNHSRFFSRTSAGKYQLDVTELRQAFLLSEDLKSRIERFRDERLSKIIANEGPVPLRGGPIVILHLVPFSSYETGAGIDVQAFYDTIMRIPLIHDCGSSVRRNFDGVLRYDSTGTILGYVQFFRSGSIEAVCSFPNRFLTRYEAGLEISLRWMEDRLRLILPRYLSMFRDVQIEEPAFLFLTIIGVNGAYFNDSRFIEGPEIIDRDLLNVPAILIEDFAASPKEVLKEAFDILWQASGHVGSPGS